MKQGKSTSAGRSGISTVPFPVRSRHLAIAAALILSACGEPEPRSVEYFSSHDDEAKAVIADCAADKVRGQECDNARQAAACGRQARDAIHHRPAAQIVKRRDGELAAHAWIHRRRSHPDSADELSRLLGDAASLAERSMLKALSATLNKSTLPILAFVVGRRARVRRKTDSKLGIFATDRPLLGLSWLSPSAS